MLIWCCNAICLRASLCTLLALMQELCGIRKQGVQGGSGLFHFKTNKSAMGDVSAKRYTDLMIDTCNGFYCDGYKPNAENKPTMWTENWTRWFLAFGGAKP